MNRKQKKQRLKSLNVEAKHEHERAVERLREKARQRQVESDRILHRIEVQRRWTARCRDRLTRILNTPKTSTGEW